MALVLEATAPYSILFLFSVWKLFKTDSTGSTVDFHAQPVSQALQPFPWALAVRYTRWGTKMASVLETITTHSSFLSKF